MLPVTSDNGYTGRYANTQIPTIDARHFLYLSYLIQLLEIQSFGGIMSIQPDMRECRELPAETEEPAFYEVITPHLSELHAILAESDQVSEAVIFNDKSPEPAELQWGQWANWASWTKIV